MDSASKQTKKKILEIKYNNLIKKLKELPFMKELPFPPLDEVNMSEIIFYLKLLLINQDDQYRQNLKNLLLLKKVEIETEEQFEEFHSIVFPFIGFIKDFL
jgi:hypothetical protein